MQRHKSVQKRHRQSVKANQKNRAIRSRIKSTTKELIALAGKEPAAKSFIEISSLLDKAVKRNILHKNTAARKKSRLAKMLNKKSK